MSARRTAILISGGGSNMLALVHDMRRGAHPATPCLVLSDRPDAAGLARAEALELPAVCVDRRDFAGDRAAFEAEIGRAIEAAGAEIVCLAGFMRVLSAGFVARWSGRMLNIHPSLLPLFPGLDTHARALAAGMAVHGATVHEVTAKLDGGPILGQAAVAVTGRDTPETLAARVLEAEHRLYPAVLRRFAAGDRARIALFPLPAPRTGTPSPTDR